MKRILLYAFIFTGILIMTGCSKPPVKIEGRITHIGTGKPIAGAFVVEEEADTFYTTDSLGYYVIPEADARKHFIAFGAVGFKPVKIEFQAEGEDSVYTINAALEPEPFEVMY